MTPPPAEQLDLFAHSRDVMLRNDALRALERHDAGAASAALRALADAFPDDPYLPCIEVQARALARQGRAPLASHDALALERDALEQVVAPAARQALGPDPGKVWLRPLWRSLAERSAGLSFLASRAEDHAATLWLRAEDWTEAMHAVEQIESWRRIPAPLAWMAEARCQAGRLDESWALLAELAWLAPARLDALLRRLDDPLLGRLHKAFGALFEGSGEASDLAWFPAWVLIDKPALAPRLALAQPCQHGAAERGMRLVLELLGLERQGRHHDLVQRRRALRDLQAQLYTIYMATR